MPVSKKYPEELREYARLVFQIRRTGVELGRPVGYAGLYMPLLGETFAILAMSRTRPSVIDRTA